jgi:hypothetical protein
MLNIPKSLLSDKFRSVIRTDIDFNSIKHKTTKNKQRKITDAMTQLMINTCDRFEHHKDFPLWNAVKLTRDYQKQVDGKTFQPFQEALTDNDFVIHHAYRPPTNILGGKTKAVSIPEDKISMTIAYLTQHSNVPLNDEISISWSDPHYFGDVPVPSKVRVSTLALNTFCESVKDVSKDLHNKWNLHLRLSLANENDGWLDQQFRVSDFGRFVGTGLSSLQTMPKTLLKEILTGCYEVDVNACSMSLLPTIYNRMMKENLSFPCIERYKKHRTTIRKVLSLSLGVDVEVVKTAFTAVGFGMRKNTKIYKNVDENWITPTLTEIFAGNQSLARSFVEHKEVKGVWKEISEIFTGLSKSTGSTLTDYSSSQRVAYLYQHAEAEMLKVMIRFVGKSLVCPKHDAVVIISPLTIRQIRMMEDKIQQTCGFDVSLTQRMV